MFTKIEHAHIQRFINSSISSTLEKKLHFKSCKRNNNKASLRSWHDRKILNSTVRYQNVILNSNATKIPETCNHLWNQEFLLNGIDQCFVQQVINKVASRLNCHVHSSF